MNTGGFQSSPVVNLVTNHSRAGCVVKNQQEITEEDESLERSRSISPKKENRQNNYE